MYMYFIMEQKPKQQKLKIKDGQLPAKPKSIKLFTTYLVAKNSVSRVL